MYGIKSTCTFAIATLLVAGCATGRSGFEKAQQLEAEGNLDAALVKYAEIASENPGVGEYRVSYLKATETAALAHIKKGDLYLAQANLDAALKEYQIAYAIDPGQARARRQSETLVKLISARTYYLEGVDFEKNRKPREALTAYRHAFNLNPNDKQIKEALERLLSSRKTQVDGVEISLKSSKPITLKFKETPAKEAFAFLGQLSGINFILDEAVNGDANVTLLLENASFQQALEIMTGMQKLGKKILNENTVVLYPKTLDKLKQYEDLLLQTFPLNKLDAKKAVDLIRSMVTVKKIYVNEGMNAVVIRDTPEVLEVARKILEANDVPDAEVLLDVEVFELNKQNAEMFGLALSKYSVEAGMTSPTSGGNILADTLTSVASAPIAGTGTTTVAATSSNLLKVLSHGGYNGYLTVPNATFNFGKTLSNGETLSNPKIRVKNREKAKFNVGSRVPVTTTSSPLGGGTNVNVQYVDVGVKVSAEPTIQLNNEVSIKLELEVSSILQKDTVGADKSTTVVTIGTRNLDTVLSLKDGETSIIGGLIQKAQNGSKTGVSGLSDLPLLGAFFTNKNESANKSELLLAITPRIVRGVTVPEKDVATFWSGREDEPSAVGPYQLGDELEKASSPPVATPQNAAPAVLQPAAAAGAAPAQQTPVKGLLKAPAAVPGLQSQTAVLQMAAEKFSTLCLEKGSLVVCRQDGAQPLAGLPSGSK